MRDVFDNKFCFNPFTLIQEGFYDQETVRDCC
jgi:hypothetical protein